MSTAIPKIVLSRSQDIPFNKLVLSQANVRRVKAGQSIEDLAEDIARRTLLQSLTVRSVRDAGGNETGIYEVPAGGRRYRALELLVKQKRLAKTAPIPCIVHDSGIAEEDSLAENIQRVALHPLDQFRAFLALRDNGLGEEEIAARFFVTPAVVKQRLKLAAVSPKLLDLYAEDAMTLDQLMAFTVTDDHARQEQVWDALQRAWNREPYHIKRLLTENTVRASDRRARFVGLDAYIAAGGAVMRDLFAQDDGGWLQDVSLLDRLVAERLAREAELIRVEGWKWVEAASDFPYGHTTGLRRLAGEVAPLTEEEQARRAALQAEYDQLVEIHAGPDDLPDEVDRRLGEIEAALEAIDNRPAAFDPAEVALGGVFLSVGSDGALRVERGFVRLEDEPPVALVVDDGEEQTSSPEGAAVTTPSEPSAIAQGGESGGDSDAESEEEGLKPLSDRLVTELTAYRTLALRDALAGDPDTAFLAVLYTLCLATFYRYATDTCLEITAKSSGFPVQAPGLKDCVSARAIDARQENWVRQLPENPAELWDALTGFDHDSRMALFAHCAALTVNVVREPWNRRPGALAHGDRLARAVRLDLAAAGWVPTVDNYLGRVPKARILEAVREAKGEQSSQLIDHLKKPDMAAEAERLLEGSGWLPEPLRTAGLPDETMGAEPAASVPDGDMPEFLAAE